MTDLVKNLAELCLELDAMNQGDSPLCPVRHYEVIERIVETGRSLSGREAMVEVAEQASEVFPKTFSVLGPLWDGINGWKF